ncbi:hypothetical protein [Micromonospora sp. NPDC023888]|uniref:hypothetical protein n=1 Tax=Micromonospora sp. NPDC023888 TaxID=3155607 RepID=UPI0034020260
MAASLWLNAGVPPTEVARRLGHGVAVLLRNCIDGGNDTMNDKISDDVAAGLASVLRSAVVDEVR